MHSQIKRSFILLYCLVASLCCTLISRADNVVVNEGQRIAFVGNSTAERMNLFGHLETEIHVRFPNQRLLVRNFGWPADELSEQQRPGNYTLIDDPLKVFAPDLFVCFFGFNESYAGTSSQAIEKFIDDYRKYIAKKTEDFSSGGRKPRFVLVTPMTMEWPTSVRHSMTG